MSTFEAKKGFALSQIRTLSTLSPNPDWQTSCPQTDAGDLPKATIDTVLQKVNQVLRRHQQLVYSSMAIDHVSEQLDTLYFQAASKSRGEDSDESNALSGRLDLTRTANIDLLPESWPSSTEGTEEDREAYRELLSGLSGMAAAVENIRKKHAELLKVRRKLEPLEDAERRVQPNLVGRDSEIVGELKRMRVLAAKLANAMEERKGELRREAEGRGMVG
ncbi:hypothetical protein ABW19_dt0202407 [Dactylella cylindrospora]|nr:hypothetical protein ABW19_dt0202407 [Dactylella cylindrospora]